MAAKKARFLNQNAAPPRPPTHWSTVADILSKVWTLVVAFAAVTTICAGLYRIGTQFGWGIQPTFTTATGTPPPVTFADCLHFSMVTIATLGYGDYRPESYGRLVVAFEVLAGIVLMGIFVSRLVSRQQDRMAKRLVRGQLNSEIQDFRDQLAALSITIRPRSITLTTAESSPVLYRARGLATSIARYWRHEAQEPDLADFIPLRAASRLLGDLIALLQSITTQVTGKTRQQVHRDDLKALRSITDSVLAVSTALSDRIEDEGIKHTHNTVVALVNALRNQFALRRRETFVAAADPAPTAPLGTQNPVEVGHDR